MQAFCAKYKYENSKKRITLHHKKIPQTYKSVLLKSEGRRCTRYQQSGNWRQNRILQALHKTMLCAQLENASGPDMEHCGETTHQGNALGGWTA